MSLLIRSAYGFGSDGAAVMVGKQSCVATQLKEHNPEMVSLHCGAHRLALASSQAVGYISYLKNLMHTSLHFISIEELGRHIEEGRGEGSGYCAMMNVRALDMSCGIVQSTALSSTLSLNPIQQAKHMCMNMHCISDL